MICQMANVSRKTFYALYHDKYEVIERIVVDNVISDLKKRNARIVRKGGIKSTDYIRKDVSTFL